MNFMIGSFDCAPGSALHWRRRSRPRFLDMNAEEMLNCRVLGPAGLLRSIYCRIRPVEVVREPPLQFGQIDLMHRSRLGEGEGVRRRGSHRNAWTHHTN